LVSLWYSDDRVNNKFQSVGDRLIQEKPIERKQVALKIIEKQKTEHSDK